MKRVRKIQLGCVLGTLLYFNIVTPEYRPFGWSLVLSVAMAWFIPALVCAFFDTFFPDSATEKAKRRADRKAWEHLEHENERRAA